MRTLISAAEIAPRVSALGAELAEHYAGRPLTVVGVLQGCVVFLADLIRAINVPHRVAFVQASSYRGATTVAGALEIRGDMPPDITGRDVLLIDDIFDTGETLAHLQQSLESLGPRSIRSVVLLRKLGRQTATIEPDWYGFEIPNHFVVGYGLDYQDDYRHLPNVMVLEPSIDLPPVSRAGQD